MKKWFSKLNERLDRWMNVRYGHDELGSFLLGLGVLLVMLAYIPGWQYLSIVAFFPACWASYRCFSKNIEQRHKEVVFYLRVKQVAKSWLYVKAKNLSLHITYKYVKCKDCGAVFQIPRGLGKVDITCPNCNNKFTTHT